MDSLPLWRRGKRCGHLVNDYITLIFWMLTSSLIYRHAENFSWDHLPSVQVLISNKKQKAYARKQTNKKQQQQNPQTWVPKLYYHTVSIRISSFFFFPLIASSAGSLQELSLSVDGIVEQRQQNNSAQKKWQRLELKFLHIEWFFADIHALLPIYCL